MKTLLMICMIYFSQELPGNVKKSFENMYPEISEHSFQKNGDKYEIDFMNDSEFTIAVFSSKGKWILTKVLDNTDLPSSVYKELDEYEKDMQIHRAFIVEDAEGQEYYEVHCEGNESEWIFNFSIDGELINHKEFPLEEDEVIDY